MVVSYWCCNDSWCAVNELFEEALWKELRPCIVVAEEEEEGEEGEEVGEEVEAPAGAG